MAVGDTYTPSQGLTPAGTQLAAGQPNATNTLPPPGSPPSAYPSDAALSSVAATDNANNVQANSASTRQGYINNSAIPAMQSNSDDLLKQLFQYDQGTLAPQFQGQDPGTPSDAVSFGRVAPSSLALTLGSNALPASQGMSIANNDPRNAWSAQNDQATSLLNLLSILNSGISNRLNNVKSTDTYNVNAAQKALDFILNEQTLKQNAVDKQLIAAKDAINTPGTTDQAGAKIEQAKAQLLKDNPKATENDLFEYISQNQAAWKAEKVNVDEVWRIFHQTFGGTKDALLAGGKQPIVDLIRDPNTKQIIGAKERGTGHMVWGHDITPPGATGLWQDTINALGLGNGPTSLTPEQSSQAQGGIRTSGGQGGKRPPLSSFVK